MIDKFPGDGVVAFFPRIYTADNNTIVDDAIKSATEVMYWFYKKFRDNFNLPKPSHTLELSAGIDSGSISIAHVGSAYHSELILLGDQVNCSSKCQAAADKKEFIIGQDAVNNTYFSSIYKNHLSTGPNIGVVYTKTNKRYSSFRFDWEQYAKDSSWIKK